MWNPNTQILVDQDLELYRTHMEPVTMFGLELYRTHMEPVTTFDLEMYGTCRVELSKMGQSGKMGHFKYYDLQTLQIGSLLLPVNYQHTWPIPLR